MKLEKRTIEAIKETLRAYAERENYGMLSRYHESDWALVEKIRNNINIDIKNGIVTQHGVPIYKIKTSYSMATHKMLQPKLIKIEMWYNSKKGDKKWLG